MAYSNNAHNEKASNFVPEARTAINDLLMAIY